ncbi:hypothetical protein EVAR_14818_1 [Eumeta japonica]|uniref:Uncharacterized protein n=1 Tax=Eumeta variegata TaxID=151549 RepID=A0A4C1V2T9_EUMVA|nr:hypothetical protein EVAR_14818_1 [Eumeta japonica]
MACEVRPRANDMIAHGPGPGCTRLQFFILKKNLLHFTLDIVNVVQRRKERVCGRGPSSCRSPTSSSRRAAGRKIYSYPRSTRERAAPPPRAAPPAPPTVTSLVLLACY